MVAQHRQIWLWVIVSLQSWLIIKSLLGAPAVAQRRPVPDDTLGSERSVVTPNVEIRGRLSDRIEGGARRGANLFHSFQEFNIEEGRAIYFVNPDGVENILTRVTGGGRSGILGRLGVLGNANLFLINPNGIVFGREASLDVGGSFIATTANEVWLGNTSFFSASEPETSSLLSVEPSALFFNAIASQPIVNRSRVQAEISNGEDDALREPVGLQVPSNRTLALIGGDVLIQGGALTAAGGRIELGSVDAGRVELNSIAQGWKFEYEDVQNFGDIRLTRGIRSSDDQSPPLSILDISSEKGDTSEEDSSIQIQGEYVSLTDSLILSYTFSRRGGDISIRANQLEIGSGNDSIQGAFISTWVYGADRGGDINIETEEFDLREGGDISAITSGVGRGGSLNVSALEFLEMTNFQTPEYGQPNTGLFSRSNGSGRAGNIRIDTGRLIVRPGTRIAASADDAALGGNINVNASGSIELTGTTSDDFGRLRSGLFTESQADIIIRTSQLSIFNGAQIEVDTLSDSSGKGGTLNIIASDFINISGTSPDGEEDSGLFARGNLNIESPSLIVQDGGRIFAGADGENQQPSGNSSLRIQTERLIVRDGAQIRTGTNGRGSGGSLTIDASESVELTGFSADGEAPSGLRTDAGATATGRAGDLTINTPTLILRGGAQAGTGTFGAGQGGNFNIKASSIEITGSPPDAQGRSGLFTETNGTGSAGNLRILTGELSIQGLSEISVGSEQQSGRAGDLDISARAIYLNDRGIIRAEAESGDGGNIRLQNLDVLLMRRGSQISTSAGSISRPSTSTGDGGNIYINSRFLVAPPSENNDITANAFNGGGGRVEIDAEGVFGLTPLSRGELENLQNTTTPDALDPSRLQSSDITAISQTNPTLNGLVIINSPDVDPSRGTAELPIAPIDATNQIAQTCPTGEDTDQPSEFVITGRGGLPPTPSEALGSDAIQVNLATRHPGNENSSSQDSLVNLPEPPEPIVEAQGWITDRNGKVTLLAQSSTPNSNPVWHLSANCHEPDLK